MSVSTLHTLYAVNLDRGDTANDILIDQISEFSIDPAIDEIVQGADGSVFNNFAAIGQQSPKMTFTTTKLATVLAKIGLNGSVIDVAGTAQGVGLVAWFQKIAQGGTRVTGSNHVKMTIAEGLLLPRQISASLNSPATLSLEAIATYDGTNDPVVVATAQALTGSPSVTEMFVAGPVKINGVTLDGIQEITVTTGIKEILQFGDGEVWPSFAAIMTVQPEITVKTLDAVSISTFGLVGAKQGATASKVYLKKIDEGGTRVADATAQHISFTVEQGRISVAEVGGSHDDVSVSEIKITPTYDGTNDPIVLSTATAIT